ncbi:MAG TPA: response regulator [Burkholderiales bacterium]|nr:response regulator [Burkholderiales bacterium]
MFDQLKILVVDDDEAVLDYLQAKLGHRYDLVSTNAPENVLELARRHRPALILCDVDMPAMDGGDVSAALYADDDTRDIPMLFLTGLASQVDLQRQQHQLGGRPAVSKSAPVEELLARIESLIKP